MMLYSDITIKKSFKKRQDKGVFMLKRIAIFSLFLLFASFLSSCCSNGRKDTDHDKAVKLIREGKAECVLLREGKILHIERGRGVSPLLAIYRKFGKKMAGGEIVDKVIGRAAAAIAINGKVKYVHGEVVSSDAVEFLKKHNIRVSWNLKVPRILNRTRTGLCPLEKSVEGITDPVKAQKALEAKIRELMKKK